MPRLLPHSLQKRFLLGLLVVLGFMGLLFAFSLHFHLQQLVEAEARERAALILAHADAVQSYVRNTLRPAMYKVLPEDRFVIEAMSTSYVTRAVMTDHNTQHERFTFRRVAINARNPESEATQHERSLIERFRNDTELVRIEELQDATPEKTFISALPVRFDPSCMRCHGDPEDAPPVLLAMYGKERGFRREVGELAGVAMVAMPLRDAMGSVRDSTIAFAGLLAGGTLVLFGVLQVLFSRIVVHNLRRTGALMHQHLASEGSDLLEQLRRDDEIEDILRTIEAFARNLHMARSQLADYAANLQSMVQARTADLQTEADARRADVTLFIQLLEGLNRSQSKATLLAASLGLMARRFGADRAAYACVLTGGDSFAWPDPAAKPALPADLDLVAADGIPRITDNAWYIPVQTSGSSRGVLCFFWDATTTVAPRTTDLALALGRQLGIALDNLDALDTLLRQNALLDSIFEGISDPLLLTDTAGHVILANSSARRVAASLEPDGGLPALLGEAGLPSRGTLTEAVTLELRRHDGRSFTLNIYPLGAPSGSHGRNVIYVRETTDEQRLLDQLRQNEKLVAVGKLAAGLAHEINNPLGVILCYAELLQASLPADEQAQGDLGIIIRHTEAAQRVVRDLLDFSRPRQLEPVVCDLNALVEETVQIFQPKARSAGAVIVAAIDDALPQLSTDTGVLRQILTNLLLNALDAVAGYAVAAGALAGDAGDQDSADRAVTAGGTVAHDRADRAVTAGGAVAHDCADRDGTAGDAVDQDGAARGAASCAAVAGAGVAADAANGRGGRVTIATRHRPERAGVEITVSDNGPGIPEDHLPRVFDPFFTTKAAGRGSGLGLAVVFGLVRDLGGHIDVRNAPGAAFTLYLPLTGDRHDHADQ